MTTLEKRLDALLTDPGWTEPGTIAYAKRYLATFQAECGDTWRDLNAVAFGDTEVCCEWFYGIRKLTIDIREPSEHSSVDLFGPEPTNEALKTWDTTNARCQIDEALANTPEERAALWSWLRGNGLENSE